MSMPSAPSENFVKDGTYRILNVYSQNYVGFSETRAGIPVTARTNGIQDENLIVWRVFRHQNGRYSLKNVGASLYASSPHQPEDGAVVEGVSDHKNSLWKFTESNRPNVYSILCTRPEMFWGLLDGEMDTPVTHYKNQGGTHTLWQFQPASEHTLGASPSHGLEGEQEAPANELSLIRDELALIRKQIEEQGREIAECKRLLEKHTAGEGSWGEPGEHDPDTRRDETAVIAIDNGFESRKLPLARNGERDALEKDSQTRSTFSGQPTWITFTYGSVAAVLFGEALRTLASKVGWKSITL